MSPESTNSSQPLRRLHHCLANAVVVEEGHHDLPQALSLRRRVLTRQVCLQIRRNHMLI